MIKKNDKYIGEYLSVCLCIGFTNNSLMVLTDSILISGSTGKSISQLSSKSSVVLIILLELLEHTVLLSGTSISLVWLFIFNGAVGSGSDWAPVGSGAGFGFLEKVAGFSEIAGFFRAFPLDASHSASFALKAEYKWNIRQSHLYIIFYQHIVTQDRLKLSWLCLTQVSEINNLLFRSLGSVRFYVFERKNNN